MVYLMGKGGDIQLLVESVSSLGQPELHRAQPVLFQTQVCLSSLISHFKRSGAPEMYCLQLAFVYDAESSQIFKSHADFFILQVISDICLVLFLQSF